MNKIKSIISYVLLLIITVVLGVWVISYLLQVSEERNTAQLPKDETPPSIDKSVPIEPINQIETSSVTLIKPEDNYQITANPYQPGIYQKMSQRLILSGDFEIAKLRIKGSVPTEDEHFLSINIGAESGAYNAVRNSSEGLDISLTKENLGVFTKSRPIDIEINLFGQQTLSTTKSEFLATRKTTKLVKFWDFINPQPPMPSVNRILIAPFNKKGNYTGRIESLLFIYACKVKDGCRASLCGNDEVTTECLLRAFGKEASDQWLEWFDKNK